MTHHAAITKRSNLQFLIHHPPQKSKLQTKNKDWNVQQEDFSRLY